MIVARMTSGERIEFTYQQDLQAYSDVELQKQLATTKGIEQQRILIQQFEINRSVLLRNYQAELNALRNSVGWRGVFGNEFAQGMGREFKPKPDDGAGVRGDVE